jgi:hypothetical protein
MHSAVTAVAGLIVGVSLAGLAATMAHEEGRLPLFIGGGGGAITGAIIGAAREISQAIDRLGRQGAREADGLVKSFVTAAGGDSGSRGNGEYPARFA